MMHALPLCPEASIVDSATRLNPIRSVMGHHSHVSGCAFLLSPGACQQADVTAEEKEDILIAATAAALAAQQQAVRVTRFRIAILSRFQATFGRLHRVLSTPPHGPDLTVVGNESRLHESRMA